MLKKFDWKQGLPYLIILLVFLVASAVYFWPAIQGEVLNSADAISSHCASQECRDYRESSGEDVWWTDSMFGGMPTYQIGGGGRFLTDKITRPIRLVLGYGTRNVAFMMFFYLLTFFLLLRSLKINHWIAMAGAFAMAMSSYFFIIIAASHMSKCYTIAWMMLVVAGFFLIYRRQWLWGGVLTSFFTYFAFYSHPQMAYYICLMLGVFVCAEIAIAAREKDWKNFGISTAVFAGSFALGLIAGGANFFANSEYSKETMRGGHSDIVRENTDKSNPKGLDIDYATAWSYGKAETLTLLIPNYQGGCSGYNLGKDSQLEKELRKMGVPARQAKSFCQGAPTYWGEKAFTSGPVYAGAVICMLFVLGLLIVRGPYKWALLVATLFSIALAWGRNFMPLTQFFYDYFPMYNKFRAVESILVVAEITIPLLGFLAIREVMNRKQTVSRPILLAGGIVALICAAVAFLADGIDVTSSYDAAWKGQVGDQIYKAILSQRHALIASDAIRSLIFVVIGTILVWLYSRYTNTENKRLNLYFGLALTVLVLADMWPVNKRYCNDSVFIKPKQREAALKMQPYEKALVEGDHSHYRVLNLTVNTFNDSRTSLYLKSTGGYHAAKLRRYQDLIDEHLSKMHMPVLSMMNTKYFIVKGRDGQPTAQLNPEALGPCWLVDELVAVDNANDESDALMNIDLRHQAVYDETYAPNAHILDRPAFQTLMAFDEEKIELVGDYAPHRLHYRSQAEHARTAVFSEVYYPYGWKATIDGAPAEIFRVNYLLRAMTIPAGIHDIEMVFDPDSIRIGNTMAVISLSLMILLLGGACYYEIRKRK